MIIVLLGLVSVILALLVSLGTASGPTLIGESNTTDNAVSPSDSSQSGQAILDPASIIATALSQMLELAVKGFTDGLAAAFGWILDSVGGEQGVYYFLVKLPVADPTLNNNNGNGVESAMLQVYPLIQNIALGSFVIVLMMAGLSYGVENFGILKQGTSSYILSSSFFTLVMLFLILPVYNTTATIFNAITDPSSGTILQKGEIMGLLKAAISPKFVNVPQGIVQTIISVFVFILVLVELLAVAILGTLRIFFVGAILVMMPLILILRLIPLTKGVVDSLIEMEIGLMLASLIAAIFLKFGYEVAADWGGMLSMLAAFGTLVGTALMPTVLAPKVGRVFSSTVSIVTAAGTGGAFVGSMTGAGVLTAGASVLQTAGGFGRVFGLSARFPGGRPLSDFGNRVVGFTNGLRLITPAMTLGGAKGFGKGLLEAAKGIHIGPYAMPDQIRLSRQSMQGLDIIRSGASYEAAMLRLKGTVSDLAFKPIWGESAKHGWRYIQSISDMDDSRITDRLVRVLGEPSLARRQSETAKAFRDTMTTLKTHPQLASRVALHLKSFEEQGPPVKQNVTTLIDSRSSFQHHLNREVEKLLKKKHASENNIRIRMQDSYSDLFSTLFDESRE